VEDWYWLGHITKLISLWIAFFPTTLRLHGLHIWLEQLRLVHDYSHPSEHRLQSRSNRTACRCHDIQISEQQWNDYGINICRISTHTFDIADYILVTKQSRNMVTQARLHPLTTFPHHSSTASRADPLFFPRYICFATRGFFLSFSLFFCVLFDCVEEGTSGGVNQGMEGMGSHLWMAFNLE